MTSCRGDSVTAPVRYGHMLIESMGAGPSGSVLVSMLARCANVAYLEKECWDG